MQWTCRQEIEDALWAAARAALPKHVLERKRLVQAVASRTALYTSEREYLDVAAAGRAESDDLAARALFFTVSDAIKIGVPLAELLGRDALPSGDRWRVLDLGAGVGAMSFGIVSFLLDHRPATSLELCAVDYDDKALQLLEGAASQLRGKLPSGLDVSLRCEHASLASFEPRERYDLVVVGSVFNELDEELRKQLAQRAFAAVDEGGCMIVVEPATRDSSRALHRLRDHLIGEGARVFAPCTHSCAPCPALEDSGDWCHEDRASVLPSRARQISQATGLRDGGLKFSYLVLTKRAASLVETQEGKRAFRVVSQPQKGKGQREGFVCSELGRFRMRLLKRNRSPRNRLFDRSRRGQVLLVDDGRAAETSKGVARLDLQKGDAVELLRPSDLED